MNIEIKFKVYDKDTKKIYEVHSITFEEWKIIDIEYWPFVTKDLSNIIILQYTWLKDRNWEELYDWDMIIDYRKNKEDGDYRYPLIISYDKMKAWFFGFRRHMLDDNLQNDHWSFKGDFINSTRKIKIWNIHIDKDLFNNNKQGT